MVKPGTIDSLLEVGTESAVAIEAPGRRSLRYGDLRELARKTVSDLNRLGVGRDDPVAIVLPNGPVMASAFVCLATGATTAPLNPSYRAEEFEFYLSDLGARILVVEEGSESPARTAAEKLGIPCLELRESDRAGSFELLGKPLGSPPESGGSATEDDIALVLHTSGTTSRPKIVPLSHRNVCASAESVGKSLHLESADRCLNIMPLFHIHGLIAAVLASLAAGASVSCTPGFNALRFYAWLRDVDPTWYTAVPTMHQAILARAGRNSEVIDSARLRFIRSSSASLPPQIMRSLEETFHAPVIEAYGMTEAAHQMASNPLPPLEQKAGSVGIPAGPEVSIMDEAGQHLPVGGVGEIVIRGSNVTGGYQNNPEANSGAFTDGWFRTGDQGVIDDDGYLRLTGRLKEIINRGGEKISPREVDEVLIDHHEVVQAVTFSMPHEKLGEDVAAAIVLCEGASASEKEIREFASTRLADFKVPRRVVLLEEIPKGPTGKLQRIGLAEKLGLVE